MNTTLKRLSAFIILLGIIAMVGAGCQTTKGLGRDVEKLGDKMQGH